MDLSLILTFISFKENVISIDLITFELSVFNSSSKGKIHFSGNISNKHPMVNSEYYSFLHLYFENLYKYASFPMFLSINGRTFSINGDGNNTEVNDFDINMSIEFSIIGFERTDI